MQALLGIAVRSGSLSAKDISYVVVHGTGTPLGDPIEIGALAAALAPDGPQMSRAVALGSVKVRDLGSIHIQNELHHLVCLTAYAHYCNYALLGGLCDVYLWSLYTLC